MQPCPLCVIQRYAFAAIALVCLVSAVLPGNSIKIGAGLAMLAALSGGGVASWHLWVKAHPAVSCGIDPLETSLNTIPTAKLMPFLFYADGLCDHRIPAASGPVDTAMGADLVCDLCARAGPGCIQARTIR